jgi:hypothetical protein
VDPLGHWRAISQGDEGSATASAAPPCHQVRPTTRQNRSASQADSAGSIPVTRSSVNAAQRAFSLTEAELSPRFRARSCPISGLRPAAYSQFTVF